MNICWSCKMVQAARESWATMVAGRQKNGRPGRSKPGNSKARTREEISQANKLREAGTKRLVQGQRATFPTPTLSSLIVVSYPKITTGPSLVKRKIGSIHWDSIHERIQGQKRDAAQCPVAYNSCAADLNGGCCPDDRICGSDSCFPITSTAGGFACGRENYIACGIPEGGGCCPSSYICGTSGCTPLPGIAVTSTCSAGFYLCPAEVNYGCCKNGMGCAINSCYSTDPITFTLTQTSKSMDSNSIVHIITTTIISKTLLSAPTTTAPVVRTFVPKESAILAPIAKTSPTTSALPSSGLTKPELGAIIGGAVCLLLVMIITALLILRKLNRAIKVTEAANSRRTSSEHHSRKFRQIQSRQQEIDAMSVDPLMMNPSEASHSFRSPNRPRKKSTLHTTTHELASPGLGRPSIFHHPLRTESPESQNAYRYDLAAASESQYSDSTRRARNPSVDITPPLRQGLNNDYFDYPLRSEPRYSQVSPIPNRRPSQHTRKWSGNSDLSAVSQNSDPAEMDSEGRRSSSQWSLNMLRRSFSRKKSDPPIVLLGGPGRADWTGGAGLGHIAEGGESRDEEITNALMDRPVQYGSGYG